MMYTAMFALGHKFCGARHGIQVKDCSGRYQLLGGVLWAFPGQLLCDSVSAWGGRGDSLRYRPPRMASSEKPNSNTEKRGTSTAVNACVNGA